MPNSYKSTANATNKLQDINSTNKYFIDNNKDVVNFYEYEGFPYVYTQSALSTSGNARYHCIDVDSSSLSQSNIYNNYDIWNEVYRGFPYTYYDSSKNGSNQTIGRARPTFVVPGTRPSFKKVFYSNMSDYGVRTVDGGLLGDIECVKITRTSNALIIYAKKSNLERTISIPSSDFQDKVVPKRLLVEIQGAGGGGGKGGTGIGGSTGNGGGAGGYWCGIIDVENVYSWEVDMGRYGNAGTSSGGTGGDASDTILKYQKTSLGTSIVCVTVKGGKGANSASSITPANGGSVTLQSVNYYYTLAYATGGNGGTTRDGGVDAQGTNELNVSCTTTISSTNSPINIKRGNWWGGPNNGGNGGGASYFYSGGRGTNWGESTPEGFNGAGGGGSAYDFNDSAPAGPGGYSGIIIWY